jgi:hypothetical protein
MSRTSFDGPLASGNKQAGSPGGSNVGLVELAQSVLLNQNGANNVSATMNLPPNSQILDALIDTLVAFDSTTAVLTLGMTPGASDYVSGINVKVLARGVAAYTSPQLLAMSNIGANTAVVATVTVTGTATVGQARVTLRYVQTGN